MYEPVLLNVRTKEEKELLISEIELLKASLFEQEQNFDYALANSVRASTAQAIKTDLEQEPADKESYLNGLLSAIDKLLPLKLTIAFQPRGQTISRLFDWVSANLGPAVYLDLEEDHSILGGATITFKGEYRDYSLNSVLEKHFSKYQKEILTLVKK